MIAGNTLSIAEVPLVVPGRIASRCAPAGDGVPVGGDWVDVVRAPGGRIVLVVGDVVGHGASAANAMSELRRALRHQVLDGAPSDVAMAHLNDLVRDRDGFATCCCVDIGPDGARATSAGHPPPVVAGLNEQATVCAVQPGPPLGVVADVVFPTRHLGLTPGDTVVLYSDGLVERPGATISDGIHRLRRAAAHAARFDVDELVDHLLELAGPRYLLRDDAAVLACRFGALSLGSSAEPSA